MRLYSMRMLTLVSLIASLCFVVASAGQQNDAPRRLFQWSICRARPSAS